MYSIITSYTILHSGSDVNVVDDDDDDDSARLTVAIYKVPRKLTYIQWYRGTTASANQLPLQSSDVNKDWTCKDKDKDLTHKDQDKDKDSNLVLKDKDKDFTYSYLLQVAAKPTIAVKQQQWTQSENSQHMTVKP